MKKLIKKILTILTLTVLFPGTIHAAGLPQGWLYNAIAGSNFSIASTAPTVNYITATSTTIASRLPYATTTSFTVNGITYLLGNVGIGTTSPQFSIDAERSGVNIFNLQSNTSFAQFMGTSYRNSSVTHVAYDALAGRGTISAPVALIDNDAITSIRGEAYMGVPGGGNNGDGTNEVADITIGASGNQSVANAGGQIILSTTQSVDPAATEFLDKRLTIGSNDNIGIGTGAVNCAASSTCFIDEKSNVPTRVYFGSVNGGLGNGGASLLSYSTNVNIVPGTNQSNIALLTVGGLSATTTFASNGFVGIGSTTPGTILSLGNTTANSINLSNQSTSTFSTGINLTGGCFAIGGACLTSSSGGSTSIIAGTNITISQGTPCSVTCTINSSGGGGSSFGYPFPNIVATVNATSTIVGFTGGLFSTASTTIGNGSVTGGLTVSGNSTTTTLLVTGQSTFQNTMNISNGLGTINNSGQYDNRGASASVYTGNSTSLLGTDGSNPGLNLSNSAGVYWTISGGAQGGTKGAGFSFNSSSHNVLLGSGTPGDSSGVLISGRHGIGTTTPYGILSISTTTTSFVGPLLPFFLISSSTSGTATTTVLIVDKTGNVGIATSTPDSTLDVFGSVRLEGNSTILTSSIGGAIIGLGCDSADTASPITIASTTVFITTPQSYPGDGLNWFSYALNSTTIRTKVCSDVTVTPLSSTYNVKIIR